MRMVTEDKNQAAQYLTAAQLAHAIKRSERTLETWRRLGGGPSFIRLGRRVLYAKSAVDTWIAANSYRSRADELARQ